MKRITSLLASAELAKPKRRKQPDMRINKRDVDAYMANRTILNKTNTIDRGIIAK